MLRCCCNPRRWVKDEGQWAHWNPFWPEWPSLCASISFSLVNLLGHPSHLKGLAPEWVITWRFRFQVPANFLPHMWQSNLPGTSWSLQCFFRLWTVLNSCPQSSLGHRSLKDAQFGDGNNFSSQYLSSVWDFLCWVNPLLCVKVLSQILQWNLSPTWFLLCLRSCSCVGNFASQREHGRLGVCWQWATCFRWLPGFRNFLPHFEQSKAAVLSWWTSMWFARVLEAANSLRQIGHLKGRTPLLQTTYNLDWYVTNITENKFLPHDFSYHPVS